MRTNKYLLVLGFIALSCARLFAGQDWTPQPIGPFGGINNRDNSFTIPANMAQDALNVNVTNQGKSVKKRPGYAQSFALAQTTSAVHGTYLFYNSSGNDVVLAFNDTKITASVAGGSATVIYSTATNSATFQCSDYLGFAYCANSARDALFKTDGAGVAQVNSIVSTGTMVAACPTRLAMAGFSGSPARIDLSADTDFTSWGTGSLGTSPVQLTVTSPGSRITHITYAFGRLMWFKETSFGYVLIGNQPLQTDWVIKTISNTIGTLDNSSTQDFNGNLYFRGQDGHIYVFDGSNVVKLSREIAGTIGSAQTRASNSLTLTSAADWAAGTFSGNTMYADTQTVSGNLQTTFPEPFSTKRDGTSGTKSVWTDVNTASSTITNTGGDLSLAVNTKVSGPEVLTAERTTQLIGALATGTSFQIKIDQIPTQAGGFSIFSVMLTTWPATTLLPVSGSGNYNWYFAWESTTTGQADMNGSNSTQNGVDPAGTLSVSTTVAVPFTFNIWIATTSLTYGVNGTQIKSATYTDPLGKATKPQYVYLNYVNTAAAGTALVDYFSIAPETFTFTSASQSVSSAISAWDSFVVTQANSAGSALYGIKSASTDQFTAITSGQVPTISTKTFWQVISTVTYSTVSSTGSPVSISDITQNWFEGSAADKAYAAFFDDKVMFSVPIGAGQSTNNRILVYDLLYQGWTLWDLPVNGFYVRNNALYFGASTGGYIHKYGVGNNDNGSAINAYWKSKDFFGADPFTTQEIANISVAASSVANSSMTVTYTLDGSNSTAYTMGLGSGTGFIGKNVNIPAGKLGSEFNVKFGNNAVDQPFEVFGVQVGVRERSWIPN